MLRKLSMLAILSSAVGVPYAMFNGEQATQMAGDLWGALGQEKEPTPEISAEMSPTSYASYTPSGTGIYDPTAFASVPNAQQNGEATTPLPSQANVAGPRQVSLAEALQMNITREFVAANWPRVTTTLADTNYAGLRVAYISGTSATDVTGSLTYYFDRNEQLQRITLHGTTGDPRGLTQLLTQQLEFEKQSTLGGELYTRSWLGRTTSVYRVRPAAVLHNGASNSRYEVLLELNRAQWRSNLSDTAKQLVE